MSNLTYNNLWRTTQVDLEKLATHGTFLILFKIFNMTYFHSLCIRF